MKSLFNFVSLLCYCRAGSIVINATQVAVFAEVNAVSCYYQRRHIIMVFVWWNYRQHCAKCMQWYLVLLGGGQCCTIFTKFSGIVGFFVLNYVLKFREIWSRGSRVPVLKICGSLVTPKYWAPLRGETVCWTPERFAVLYHHAKFGGARTLHGTRGGKNVDVLSFCLSVMLLNGKVSEHWRS